MNKTDFIAAVAEKSGLSKKDVAAALASAGDVITAAIASGDKVQLVGFGTFEAKAREERTARNPRTGESVTVAACKVPSFKAGKALKDQVNQ